jgi:hypothetical protein
MEPRVSEYKPICFTAFLFSCVFEEVKYTYTEPELWLLYRKEFFLPVSGGGEGQAGKNREREEWGVGIR